MATADNYGGVFDGRLGFGERPAVLVVDFVLAYTTPGEKLFAPAVVDAVEQSGRLLSLAREKGVPIVYTRVLYHHHGLDGGVFTRKVPLLREFVANNPMTQVVPQLAPQPHDTVLIKQYASAFFGTPLAPMLCAQGVDTLILTGCSTSGCIRATAVDGCQHGFRVMVPRECVGDRHPAPHEANLFDIDSKYGDVVSREQTLAYLTRLPTR